MEHAIRTTAEAWNQKDVEGYLATFTNKGLREDLDATREEARQFLPGFIGEAAITVRMLSNTRVSGDTATTEADLTFGMGVNLLRFSMVKQGDVWKIDGEEHLLAAIPSGVTTVDVKMVEFAFAYDPGAAAGGNVAFSLENIGQQRHEFAIAKVPEGPPLQEILETGEGVELIGQTEVDPGQKGNLVFTEALAPGRYATVCFLPDVDDPEQTPHAFKGMVFEFTVQ